MNRRKGIIREQLSESDARFLWELFLKVGAVSPDLPSNPDIVYKNDWKGWFDWFGIEAKDQIIDASYEGSDRQKLTRHLLMLKVQGGV